MADKSFFAATPKDAPSCWQVDILCTVLAHHGTTGGDFALIEELCPKDSRPPPHVHDQDEMFQILGGEITFQVGDKVSTAGSGDFVMIPAGTVHGFRIDSDTARVLNMYRPAGFEQVLMGTAETAERLEMPPKGRGMAVSMDEAKPLFERWGMHTADVPDRLRDGDDDRSAP